MQYLFGDAFDRTTSKAIFHGITPPLDTPLQWLARHLTHADNFCHVVVEL